MPDEGHVDKYVPSDVDGRLNLGEIISGLVQTFLTLDSLDTDAPSLDTQTHPFAILLSQDCDLEQHYARLSDPGSGDPGLPNMLFCEAIDVDVLRSRLHGGSKRWEKVKSNKDERYHCLEGVKAELDSAGDGIGSLGIDFKRCFTIRSDEVYQRLSATASRRTRLIGLYAQHLSRRFYYFHSRVGLPQEHLIELAMQRAQRTQPPPVNSRDEASAEPPA